MMLYGSYTVISATCDIDYKGEFGFFGKLFHMVKCSPWVAWVGANAGFHCIWVTTLTICQSYQVSWLFKRKLSRYIKAHYRDLEVAASSLK